MKKFFLIFIVLMVSTMAFAKEKSKSEIAYDHAVEIAAKAKITTTDMVKVIANSDVFLEAQSRYEKALKEYEKAKKENKNIAEAKKKFEAAQKEYERFLKEVNKTTAKLRKDLN